MQLTTLQPRPTSAGPAGALAWGGIRDLGAMLLQGREGLLRDEDGKDWLPPISTAGLYKLLELAFYASMMPEEGRFPPFTLVNAEDDWRVITVFDPPIPVESVETLRRLAPSCKIPDCALWIVEQQEFLWCNGIVDIGPRGCDKQPGYFGVSAVGRAPSLVVQVHGPGHIIAGETDIYEFRAGRIRQVVPFQLVPAVQSLAADLARTLVQQGLATEGQEARRFGAEWSFQQFVHRALSRTLQLAMDKRHGGTFVILPTSSSDFTAFHLATRYKATSLDIGAAILDLWKACVHAGRLRDQVGYSSAVAICHRYEAQLWTKVDVLANLSAVDGCVILNRSLQLCGFGAEIQVADDEARTTPRHFRTWDSQDVIDYELFMQYIGGTRHRSAARLCQVHDGMITLVVSQDGELRIFCTDGDVYGFGPLDTTFSGF
ncbi:MAG: putative sensor domain DACNV-containing protein [Candidatus Tectimicrobiota bacterium]